MKKILCLLVDDEPFAIRLLQKHVEELDFLEVVATCRNAVQALQVLKQQPVDLLFLDIQMPQLSGISFLKSLPNPPKTIITTAHREYALDGYDLDITDYLLKPITFERFFKAIERYMRTTEQAVPVAIENKEDRFIFLKSGYKQLKIGLADILYIESVKDYIKVRTSEKEITAKYKLTDIEMKLKGKGFLRIHRSYMVNLKNITAFSATDVELGTWEIPIGETYKEEVFKVFNGMQGK